MKTEQPPHRRKFADERDQLNYLYHKLLYWLYQRQHKARAALTRIAWRSYCPSRFLGMAPFSRRNAGL